MKTTLIFLFCCLFLTAFIQAVQPDQPPFDVVADLAADYVNPGVKTGVKAEFPDATGGRWAFYNCKNRRLLSTAVAGDVKPLNSQFKAFGSLLGYAYGLEQQGDELGFVSDYAPSDRQEDAWRNHYTVRMIDQVLSAAERKQFLYTNPIADTACYNVFRWTPSTDAQKKDVTVCGKLFSVRPPHFMLEEFVSAQQPRALLGARRRLVCKRESGGPVAQ
jgi:hypothetical protein